MTADLKSELAFIKGMKDRQLFARSKDILNEVFLYISGVSFDSNNRINLSGMGPDSTLHVSLMLTHRSSYRTVVDDVAFIEFLKNRKENYGPDFSVPTKLLRNLVWNKYSDY